MTLIDSESIDTPAGRYIVEFHTDEAPDQPHDEGFGLVTTGDRRRIAIDTGADGAPTVIALLALRAASGAAIVRYLRLAGLRGVTLVDSEYRPIDASTDRDESVYGVAWAPDDATNPDEYVRVSLEEWRAWSTGDVFGFIVKGPDGERVEDGSVWGFYGMDANREYVMQYGARYAIDADVDERIDAANRIGAGLVGIV